MAGVSIQLGQAALFDVVTIALAGVSLLILLRWKVNSAWLISAGAVVGLGGASRRVWRSAVRRSGDALGEQWRPRPLGRRARR